ncbi:MAG: uroporphyrinogen decarboxylase family protein [Armatimonadota bacterium]|nr:uroporphyrinogen decarboxylase family protein [Armatimonadota bacterium]
MDLLYESFMGMGPKRIAHYEHWSCPDAETQITGVDYYDHPKLCRERMRELYPVLNLAVPADDTPVPRPQLGSDDDNSSVTRDGRQAVRWGTGETWHWDWGRNFKTVEEAFAFSPLKHADFTNVPVVESRDYSDEEKLYESYRSLFPAEHGDTPPDGQFTAAGFYNTMFMWPLLTFGWEFFLEMCLEPRFERIMDEFAEINRRVFRSFARLPVKFVICHDDIVTARGPVCSPDWMNKFIFPRYEEFWGIVKAAGKEVVFVADGCLDACADDIFACGARGIITEPFTDFKAIARKHENCCLAGEGDNRVLSRNDPDEIRAMVESMVETAHISGGYMMSVGNHIPWNVTPEGVKRYLDLCDKLAHR